MADAARAHLRSTPDTTRRGLAIAAGYGAQGLGYAAVMTALPSSQERWSIDATTIAIVVLGTCVAAALGSILADVLAVRSGSRTAMRCALLVQTITLLGIAFAPTFPVYITMIAAYGVGLGLMDAAQNMQGVLLENTSGRALLGRFYACYTAASIIGALSMSAFLASNGAITGALVVAALAHLTVALVAVGRLDPRRAARRPHQTATALPRLPRGRILAIGLIVLGVYALDSAVSTWSTVYLQEGLRIAPALAPLGYAAYQGAVLVMRLVTDPLEARAGRMRLAGLCLALGIAGCVVVAASPDAIGAIVGFSLAGLATGALVPLAFSAAGSLMPSRSDEIIARVNLFNYGGAVAGAVVLGLIASGSALGPAFLIPGGALLAFAPFLRFLRASRMQDAAPAQI